MPYSWALATAGSDKVILSCRVEVDYRYEFTASNGTGTAVQLASSNQVNENLATIRSPERRHHEGERERDYLKPQLGWLCDGQPL